MTVETERREYSRVAVNIEARVASGDREIACRSTRDLSMKGVYVSCDETHPVGSDCVVTLVFDAAGSPIDIEVNGTVVRHGDDGMAVQFDDVQRIDNFEKVRNLVIYQALKDASLPIEPE